MNKLILKNFIAERHPDGDVWIHTGEWSQQVIQIPQEDCAELARLLLWPVISESHKVDYALSVNEPE